MDLYTVKSGQNIYDVALTLYGSVEGIFDLLTSNTSSINGSPLSMTTMLEAGQALWYHKDFVVNQDIVDWFVDNDVDVKNGEGGFAFVTPLDAIIRHYYMYHSEEYDEIASSMTADEQTGKWKEMSRPRIVVRQQGNFSAIETCLYAGTHMMIDWGDCAALRVIDGGEEAAAEHQYDESGSHTIRIYGDFACHSLDFTELNGIHYCIDNIQADQFTDSVRNETLNTLIETQE